MKGLLLAFVVLGLVSCTQEQKPNPICPIAKIGVSTVMNLVVANLKTCSAVKLTNKVMPLLKCQADKAAPVTILATDEKSMSIDMNVIKLIVCPVAMNLIAEVIGLGAGAAEVDCDPAIISALVKDANACSILFK